MDMYYDGPEEEREAGGVLVSITTPVGKFRLALQNIDTQGYSNYNAPDWTYEGIRQWRDPEQAQLWVRHLDRFSEIAGEQEFVINSIIALHEVTA